VLLLVQGGHGVRRWLLQTCAGWRRGYRAKNIKPKNISVSVSVSNYYYTSMAKQMEKIKDFEWIEIIHVKKDKLLKNNVIMTTN
jgi:hypothetical protein